MGSSSVLILSKGSVFQTGVHLIFITIIDTNTRREKRSQDFDDDVGDNDGDNQQFG
jgi:hypothetical protein